MSAILSESIEHLTGGTLLCGGERRAAVEMCLCVHSFFFLDCNKCFCSDLDLMLVRNRWDDSEVPFSFGVFSLLLFVFSVSF